MIARINPRSRRDRYGSRINRDHSQLLANFVPWASIIIASVIPIFPLVSGIPIWPPLGFLLFLAWQFVRPGLLPVWAGFPLGLWDDLFSGQPFGSAILMWSLSIIALEYIEARFPWRGFLQDWMTAILVTGLYLALTALLSGGSLGYERVLLVGPQFLLSILIFPVVGRLVAILDRLRLLRIRVIG